MVGASDEVQLVALMRAQKRATIVTTAGAGSVASSRAERVRLCDQDFPHERDQIVRTKLAPIEHADLRHNSPPLWTRRRDIRRPTPDTDSHGVSDPPDTRGAISSARTGVAHAMVSCSDRGTGACAVGGKERRPSCWCRALTVKLAARESVIGGAGGRSVARVVAAGGSVSDALGGTTSISEVVPQVVLCC